MKSLLTTTAVVEFGAGVALSTAPSLAASTLLGSPIDSRDGLIVGRMLGAALFAIGTACWLSRGDSLGRSTLGLITGLLIYNAAAVGLFAHASIGLGMTGPALWPAVVLHAALAAWCIARLRAARWNAGGGPMTT